MRLAAYVHEAERLRGAVRRCPTIGLTRDEPLDVPLPLTVDAGEAVGRLLDLTAEVDTPARDAYIDLEKRELKREAVGYRLDVYSTLARIDAALRHGEDAVDAAVETIPPRLSAAELGNVKFDHVLGYFETRYGQGGKSKERTYNLRLAASKLDGTVVMPGQTFDFNGTVGPRDEAHGYRVAPVIAQGEGAGRRPRRRHLPDQRHPAQGRVLRRACPWSSATPTRGRATYIKLRLPTRRWSNPTINFRFKNSFDAPIVLHETVANGVVRAEILGAERKLTVSYFRRIDEVVPFDEVERKTAKLPEGVRAAGAARASPAFARRARARGARQRLHRAREVERRIPAHHADHPRGDRAQGRRLQARSSTTPTPSTSSTSTSSSPRAPTSTPLAPPGPSPAAGRRRRASRASRASTAGRSARG